MVLNEFPEWLQCSIDRIKDTNNKLKRITNEKKEIRRVVCQCSRVATTCNNSKKGKKKSNSDEDDVTFGPRDCDIGMHVYSYIFTCRIGVFCFFKFCIFKISPHFTVWYITTTAVVDRIKAGKLDVDYFCTFVSAVMWRSWECAWNIYSSAEVFAIANARFV